MRWDLDESESDNEMIGNFDGDYREEEMGIIIYGVPENDFDIKEAKVLPYTEDQIEYLKELAEELPIVMDIVMHLGKFKAGHYRRKYHNRDWKKYEPK